MPEQQDLTPSENVIILKDDVIQVRIQRLPGNPEPTNLVLEDDNSLLVDLRLDQG